MEQDDHNFETTHADLRDARRDELWKGDLVVVFTDGACRHNQLSNFRRAGCGVFWAVGHAKNISEKLPGTYQSNQRAELHAILLAVRAEHRPLEMRTDSKYCMDGWQRYIRGHWTGSWYGIEHADLWQSLAAEVAARITQVQLTKVKGHAKSSDVKSGRVRPEDKIGNDWADVLAT
eukprot:9069504-Karenia_brevis.AAC.1